MEGTCANCGLLPAVGDTYCGNCGQPTPAAASARADARLGTTSAYMTTNPTTQRDRPDDETRVSQPPPAGNGWTAEDRGARAARSSSARNRLLTGKAIRRGILGAICVLLILALHGAGVFIAAGILFCWGCLVLGIKIYTGGTRYIARTHAEEAAKLADKRNGARSPGGLPPFCRGCGQQVQAGGTFCGNCGAPAAAGAR